MSRVNWGKEISSIFVVNSGILDVKEFRSPEVNIEQQKYKTICMIVKYKIGWVQYIITETLLLNLNIQMVLFQCKNKLNVNVCILDSLSVCLDTQVKMWVCVWVSVILCNFVWKRQLQVFFLSFEMMHIYDAIFFFS